MQLNIFGEIIKQNWLNLPNIFENVILDEFIIMPNHFHGIIIFLDTPFSVFTKKESDLGKIVKRFKLDSLKQILETIATVTDNQKNTSKKEKESTKNVATVTDGHNNKNGYNGYKNDSNTNPQWRSVIASTENLLQNYKTIWQKSFHDRVIRNDKELTVYQEYVLNNPIRWQLDLLNPINNDKFQQWIKKNRKTKESFD